jgi:hypothetical protein
MQTTLISTPDDGDKDSICNIGQQPHSDMTDHARRLHCKSEFVVCYKLCCAPLTKKQCYTGQMKELGETQKNEL